MTDTIFRGSLNYLLKISRLFILVHKSQIQIRKINFHDCLIHPEINLINLELYYINVICLLQCNLPHGV